MQAICKFSRGDAIPPSKRYLGELDQTDYSPLNVGGSYLVHALLFIFDRVDFLVRAPGQPPFWAPGCLFDLADAKIPSGWEFCITQSRTGYATLHDTLGINFIAGYPLLVNEYKHYIGLIEREPTELQRFMDSVPGE